MEAKMMSSSAVLGGMQALPLQTKFSKLGGAGVASTPRLMTSLAGRVRCNAGKGQGPLADAKAVVDQQTKKTITKDDILRNQETNESEKKSVMGTEPTSGSLWSRPEVERSCRRAASRSSACSHSMAPHPRPSTAAWQC